MERILETLTSDPIYLAVGGLLVALLVVSALKQVIRLALVALVAILVFAFYLDGTGKQSEADAIRDALVEKSGEVSESLKEKLQDGGEHAAKALRDAIEGEAGERAKEMVEKAGDAAKAIGKGVRERTEAIKEQVEEDL